jgi:hypothetical protein
MSNFRNGAIALGLAGAVVAASAPSFAAPVMSSAAMLKQSAGDHVEQVRWRGRGVAAAGIGLAAGALVGSAIASSNRGYYGGGYYGGGYYGAPAAYGGYYDAPVYAAPAPTYVEPEVYAAPVRPGRCWITTGGEGQYGYWSAC